MACLSSHHTEGNFYSLLVIEKKAVYVIQFRSIRKLLHYLRTNAIYEEVTCNKTNTSDCSK